MALDFQQVRQQIIKLAEKAPNREEELRNLRETAEKLLSKYAADLDYLRDKVERAANLNKNLRCAIPTTEGFTDAFPLPGLPDAATIIAADGSQINPNRHWALEYCLVNVGAIQLQFGGSEAPEEIIRTRLYYDEELYTGTGTITEGMVALIRDQREREVLAELAEKIKGPIVTFTDGPVELWGLRELKASQRFERYLKALSKLHKMGSITAGYVDKPRSTLVIRLLELAALSENKIEEAGKNPWLLGIFDSFLFEKMLNPGERTALFGIQSPSAKPYQEELALHFFYLNVSMEEGNPYLVRIEVPAWVADNKSLLDDLHAVLVDQCQVVQGRPYPYLLHRAHETAVVTRDEKEQVDMMISVELSKRGLVPGYKSSKQYLKELPKRARK
jgi:hypothetical protein